MAEGGGADRTRAHSARVYDYFLGGTDNHAGDRAAAARIEEAIPDVRAVALENRAFMRRVIGHLAAQGVEQFLDIGAGIPTEPNLHQIAQRTAPGARVVYVDNDPIVLDHARARLTGTSGGRTEYIQADLTEPDRILTAPAVRAVLDPDRPVALSLIAVCHFVPGEKIYDIVEILLRALAPGSYLVMTHLTPDLDPETAEATVAAYQHSGIPMQARTYDEVGRMFETLDLLPPGIVPIGMWHPGGPNAPVVALRPERMPAAGYAAVGRKR